jgi:hypothetical protein
MMGGSLFIIQEHLVSVVLYLIMNTHTHTHMQIKMLCDGEWTCIHHEQCQNTQKHKGKLLILLHVTKHVYSSILVQGKSLKHWGSQPQHVMTSLSLFPAISPIPYINERLETYCYNEHYLVSFTLLVNALL